MPSMPNVRDSSGTIGTMRGPMVLSRSSVCRICTNAIVVEISRSSVLLRKRSNVASCGTGQRFGLAPPRRQVAAELHPPRLHVLVLGRVRRRTARTGPLRACRLPTRIWKRSRMCRIDSERHLLLLVRDVLRFARLAHAEALDRLGEDHRRLALVVDRHVKRRVDLVRVEAAAVEVPDLVVGPVGDEGLELRRIEEMLADVGAVLALEGLVLAVDAFHHPPHQDALLVAREQRVPAGAPDDLDDVPAGAAEVAFQFLDDLAVAAHGTVETLQVAVDDEDQVVEVLAPRHADGAHRLRLVHLAVAAEAHTLRPSVCARPRSCRYFMNRAW